MRIKNSSGVRRHAAGGCSDRSASEGPHLARPARRQRQENRILAGGVRQPLLPAEGRGIRCHAGRGATGLINAIYDPVSDTWERKDLLTKFSYFEYELTAARVFLNGLPRVEVVGGSRVWPGSPGNNQQYIP